MTASNYQEFTESVWFQATKRYPFEKNASYFRKNNLCLGMSRAQGVNTTDDY